MEKVAVVYKTKYGSSEKYAEWLSKSLKADVYEMDNTKIDRLKGYNTIIFISGVYAGRIEFVNFIGKHFNELSDKKLVGIIVGALPENNWWSRINYLLIPGRLKKKVKFFKIYGKPPGEEAEPIKKSNLDSIIAYLKR
ncbi:MAG: hypothetical protein JW791_03050 [Nanoarchaeota archaeon]|nr:hypothetical protein [Nanoarchaeota archaeon]